jgi:hypothetical protein
MGIVCNVSLSLSVSILNANVLPSLILGVHLMHITKLLHEEGGLVEVYIHHVVISLLQDAAIAFCRRCDKRTNQ